MSSHLQDRALSHLPASRHAAAIAITVKPQVEFHGERQRMTNEIAGLIARSRWSRARYDVEMWVAQVTRSWPLATVTWGHDIPAECFQ